MMIKRNIIDFGIISYECSSAENLIDGGDGVTIPPVVARIFSGDRSSPLTREASLVRGEAVDVLLRRLWGLRGSVGVKQSFRLDGIKV